MKRTINKFLLIWKLFRKSIYFMIYGSYSKLDDERKFSHGEIMSIIFFFSLFISISFFSPDFRCYCISFYIFTWYVFFCFAKRRFILLRILQCESSRVSFFLDFPLNMFKCWRKFIFYKKIHIQRKNEHFFFSFSYCFCKMRTGSCEYVALCLLFRRSSNSSFCLFFFSFCFVLCLSVFLFFVFWHWSFMKIKINWI